MAILIRKQRERPTARDPGISALVEYFDEPQRFGNWEALNTREFEVVRTEAQRCRDDFTYAARNYFWIIDKKTKQEKLFTLWESQQLILQVMQDLRNKGKIQKLMILKARQLGCSTLLEALAAWVTIFFKNTNGLVVSYEPDHSAHLFDIMTSIYFRLPWWMQPMYSSMEFKHGIIFENPDRAARSQNPGMNSRLKVESANKMTGVGTGYRLDFLHACLAPWSPVRMRDGSVKPIIEVQAGEEVLTSAGIWRPCKGVFKSHKRNEITSEINLWGNAIPLTLTRDHKVLTPDGMRPSADIPAGAFVRTAVRPIEEKITTVYGRRNKRGWSQVNAQVTFFTWDSFRTDRSFGYLCGLYLAEGSVHHQQGPDRRVTGVQFGIHKKEEGRVRQRIKEALGDIPVQCYRHLSQTMSLTIGNSALARFMSVNFGRVQGKRIPDWVWQCGRDFCLGLVQGYLEGDGHVATQGDRITATSVRLAITIQLRDLVASLGFGWSALDFKRGGMLHGRNCQDAWAWSANGATARALKLAFEWLDHDLLDFDPWEELPEIKQHWRYSACGKYVDIEVASNDAGYCPEFWDLEVDDPLHDFTTLQCVVANSEWCLWGSSTRSIIEGDFNNALADRPSTMAVLESTGDRAGSYAHALWKKNVELGERAEWTPLFLPSFFESNRKYPLPAWWAQRGGPEKPEADMRIKIQSEWLQCSEEACAAYGETIYGLVDQTGKECRSCGRGKMFPVEISDEYLYWMEVRRLNAEKDEESLKELRRQQCVTSSESWQTEGVQLFSQACRDWVQFTTKKPIFGGSIDNKGNFHGILSTTGKCASEGCDLNHIGEETLTKVWQMPVESAEYSIGVDVAEGLGGTADYSTVFVNRVRREGSGNDEQVALFRSNEIDPIGLAYVANALGRRYNDAMIAVELNRFDTCGSYLRLQLSYPNIYRWKLLGSTNILSTRMGWLTTVQSKPRLYTTAIRWLKANTWTIRSTNFLEEMGTFNKATDSRSVNAGEGFHDDELMAGMIALYCSHEADFDENLGFIPMTKKLTVENAPWVMSCNRCGQKTPGEVPRERSGCPYCGCMLVAWARNGTDGIAVADPASIILPPEYFDSLEDQKIRAIDYELI